MNISHVLLIAICFLAVMVAPVYGEGEVVLDGTMGAAGKLNGPEYDIEAEYGRAAGANLFHSFSTFNIGVGERATFHGPDSVRNIISRVTGGARSSIDGSIKSTIPEANLYLLNPAGVLFGENASLDIGGSFHVSTADYLRMGENDRFYSTPKQGEVLFAAAPTAFGFLDSDVAGITLHGKGDSQTDAHTGFIVREDQTISLVGGDIEISNVYPETMDENDAVTPARVIAAPGGRLNIASVTSPGEVTPTSSALEVTSPTLGDITISEGAIIDVSGEGSGNVFIRGGRFFLKDGGQIKADSTGERDGGVIDIRADVVELDHSDIFSDAQGSGDGGDITIVGAESVSVTDGRIYADATNMDPHEDSGDAGSVTIATKRLVVAHGQVSSETFGKGAGGAVALKISESIDISGEGAIIFGRAQGESEDAGDAGTIIIETPSLSLSDGAVVTGDTTKGGGKGGSILIQGFDGGFADSVRIADGGQILAGAIDGEFTGRGEGGSITIRADRIALTNGGRIDSISEGRGDAGLIDIEARDSIRLNDRSQITTMAVDEGDAGEINIRATNLYLANGSSVSSESASTSAGAGAAGGITVAVTDSVELFGDSALTTEARGAGGGRIHVSSGDRIYLLDGEITSSVRQGEGKGGDVRTASEFVILNNGAIIANAEEGDGGAIFIETENYLKSSDSVVSATSKRGNDGTVRIEAPDLDITSGLVTLPADFLDVTEWVETPCAERSGESVSRFVVKGWDASPDRVDDLRPFELFWFEESGEGDDPGRMGPPGDWPLDREGGMEERPDCPDGNC